MINIAPRTYHEVVRLQKCYTLASHYTDITEDVFSRIYRFLGQSERNAVVAGRHIISLVCKYLVCHNVFLLHSLLIAIQDGISA